MKLRLPHKLQAALIATLASVSFTTLSSGTLAVATGAALLAGQQAQAYSRNLTTTYTTAGDTIYNGYVFTMGNSGTNNFSVRTFQQVEYNEQGQWVNEGAPITSSNNDVDTPLGRGRFWTMYCSTSNADKGIDFGNTLRLSGATSQQKVGTDFTDFTIGGLITDGDMNNASAAASGNSTYWFYRGASMDINGTRDVNMDINSHVRFSYGGSVNMKKGGTWTIHSGKSLTFDNNSRNTATTFKFFEGQALKVQGGGALYLGNSSNNGTYNVEMQTGSSLHVTGQGTTVNVVAAGSGTFTVNGTITVDAGSTLNINQNTTLGRTITNAGTLTVASGKTVTLTSDLSGFDYEATFEDYEESEGKGFAGNKNYVIINNTGNCSLTQVTYNGTAKTLDGGKMLVEGATDYTTYYIQADGASLNLDQASAHVAEHGAGATLSTVEVGGANATITVGSAQNLANLNIAGGKSVTTAGTGTLTLGALSNGGTLNIGSKVTMGAVAFTSSDAPAIHVTEGGVYTIATDGTTVDGKRLMDPNGTYQEAGQSGAFTKIFMGKVVDVQAGGKLVLQGNVCFNDSQTGGKDKPSGVANLEITGSLRTNVSGTTQPWLLGSNKMKVGDYFWLTNNQNFIIDGGTLEVGGQLLLGHEANAGGGSNHPASLTASGGSTVTLGGIGLYGPNNAFSLTGGSLTFTAASAATNVLTNEGSHAHNNNTITLAGTTLHAGENGWTLAPVEGATVSVSGTTTVDVASGKQISLTANSINGKFVFAEGATGTLLLSSANGVLANTEAIALNGATVGFAGTWDISAMDHGGSVPTYSGGKNPGINGFVALQTDVTLASGGTITAESESAKFIIKGAEGHLDASTGIVSTSGDTDYSTFHVMEDYENVTQGRAGGTYDPVYSLADSARLVVDADLTGAKLTRESGSTGNATLDIQSDKTYTSDGNAKTITITGAGTYALKSGTYAMVDSLAQGENGWTGTVVITNAGNNATINEESLVNGTYSTLQMEGFNGWFSGNHWYGERNQNIKLVDYVNEGGSTVSAWKNGAYSGSDYTLKFTGTWSGSGTFERVGGSAMDYDYSGNIAAWDGKFLMSGDGTTDLRFYGAANTVNAAIDRTAGTLNVEVGDGTNAFTATFNKAVNASKLEIKNGASATFEKAVTLNGNLSLRGTETARASVLLKEGATLNSNLDLSNARSSHGTVTVAAQKVLDLKGTNSNFWMSSNSSIVLEQGAQAKLGSALTVTGLSGAASTISNTNSGDDVYGLGKAGFTLTNVEASVNSDQDDVQLHFDNSKFVTSHTVTLKNLESVFSGMEIGGGTTTVGASGLTESATVQLGAVSLSNSGTLALANHVTGSVSGVEVAGSGTISGGTLLMGRDALITLGDNAVLTLSGVTVDLGSKELQGDGTRYDYGQHEGNGFAITEGKVQLVNFSTGSAIDQGTGVSYKYGSNSGTLITEGDDQGYVTFGEASYNAFYVRMPGTTESMEEALKVAGEHLVFMINDVYLQAGTLDITNAEIIPALHVDSGSGTVSVVGTDFGGIGTIDGKGNLNTSCGLIVSDLNVAADETLTITGGGTLTVTRVANHGTLGIGTGTKVATTTNIVVNAGETFTTTGEGTLASTAELTVQGGTATLGSKSEWSVISIGNGSLNINADTTVSGNFNVGSGNGERSGDITVAQGATLTVNKLNTPWGFGSMTINGVFNATEQFSINTGAHEYEITGTGTINTKELIIQNTTTKAIFSGGLTINIGDNGIKGDQPLELRDVTVGVLDSSNGWSANRAIALGDASTGTTFNIGDGKAVTLSGAISGSGKLVKDGDGTLNLAYIINNNGYTGNIEVKDGTMVVNGTSGDAFHSVSVAEGATVELIGKTNQDYRFRYTLDGGTLTSSGSATGGGNVQNDQITLTKSSTISGSANFYMLGGSYNETSLNLGGFTLTKEGGNTVSLINTDVSTGSIVVKAGTLDFLHHNGKADSRVQADIELNGGTITGTYTYKASDSPVTRNLTVNQSAVTSAAITIGNNVTLATNVAEHQVLTLGGAITGTGNFSLSGAGTLKLAGSDMISANTLTFNSGSTLDVSNIAQMAGITVNLASYTGSASYTGVNITGLNSGLTYSLTDDGSHVAITFASQQVTPPTPTSPNLGNVMYVGDSITDGEAGQKSWRYSFFQVLADGGIGQTEEGYFQHTQTSRAITTTTYGGRTFENNHSAHTSARSTQTAGLREGRYDNTNIKNWLGISTEKTDGTTYPEGKPVYEDENAPNTYFMLLGTNDLLSEGGNHVTDAHFNSVLASMFGYNGSTFDGTSGTFDIIWGAMTEARAESKLIVLEMPTWSPNHGNHQNAADFAYMTKFNQKLHEWADTKANKAQITIVNPNPGIVDVANTSKPGSGVATMFADGLHPSAQGELLIAGNIAKQLGYAGRTVGLDRASYTEPGTTVWHAEESSIAVTSTAQTFAENAFSTADGYTIDFGALYGDGFSGGWSDKANALTVQVGDGYNIGTLTFSEAYVMWGGTVLYSRDNSQEGDNFRIAYVNQSVKEEDHVSTGYYVWMGDQLIGEALSGVSGSFNGISLTSTGAEGTVKNLTWSDTAYAPITKLYENPDSTKLFHLEQANTLPTHTDTPQGIEDDIEWQTTTDKFALPNGQSSTEKTIYKEYSSNIAANYTGAANADYEGDIGMHYTGTVDMDARQSVLSVWTATVTGNVYMQFDNPNTVYNSFTNTDQLSVTASYNGNITVSYTAVYNAGIFNFDVRGGEHNNDAYTIGEGSYSYVNGGTFKANVMGGGRRGTINGGTHVTVEGILPIIKGNISADNVTLKDVVNPQEYVDGFDSYKGTITATTLTLDNYKAGEMLATVTAANLALTNGTDTVINHLTTAAGTAISVSADSSLTLGQANLSAAIANAGALVLTQNITASGLVEEAHRDYQVGADDEESENDNYFYTGKRTEGTLRVVSGEGDLQVADGLTVTQGGHAYTLASDGTATGVSADNVDYRIFVQSEAGTTLNVSDIAATSEKHGQFLWQVAVDSADLVVDRFVQYVQLVNARATNTVDTDFIGALQVAGGDNTLVGSVTSLPGMTQFVQGAEGSLKMQNATATPYQVAAGNDVTFADTDSVTIHAAVAAAGSESFDVYSLNNARFTVEADTLQAMNTTDQTVDNHLKVASIATGGASLTLANGVEETLKNVTALSGDIKFLNMAEARGTTAGKQTQVGLDSLYIGSSKTVSFYENGIVDAANEASVTVSGTLTAGVGAQLNADLEMAKGSHLDVSGAQSGDVKGLLMGSEVTLNSGSYLDIKNYTQDQVSGYLYDYLTTGGHDLYYLFSGTENDPLSLKIDGKQVEQLTFTDWTKFDKDASEVYANLQAQTFYMVYDGSNVGMVAIGLIPEPTTSTLSLLALCALAARRRRK